MLAFTRPYRFGLRNKLTSILSVIIRPAMYFGNISFPVTMSGIYGSSPLQRIGSPWILCTNFSALVNRIEEVEHKQELSSEHHNCYNGDHLIEVSEIIKVDPTAFIEITAGYTGQPLIVHRPVDQIRSHHSHPKVDIRHGIVQITSEHFGEPVIYPGKHAKERGHTHYNMEVCYHKHGIVQVDINGRVP